VTNENLLYEGSTSLRIKKSNYYASPIQLVLNKDPQVLVQNYESVNRVIDFIKKSVHSHSEEGAPFNQNLQQLILKTCNDDNEYDPYYFKENSLLYNNNKEIFSPLIKEIPPIPVI